MRHERGLRRHGFHAWGVAIGGCIAFAACSQTAPSTSGSGGSVASGGVGGSSSPSAGGTSGVGGAATGGTASSIPPVVLGGTAGVGATSGAGGQTARSGTSGTGGRFGTGGVTVAAGSSTGGQSGTGDTSGVTGSGGVAGADAGGSTKPDAADAGGSDRALDASSAGFEPCPPSGNCKILPLGDSITAGAGAQPGDNGGYRTELFTKAVADAKHITFVGSLSSGPTTVAGVAFPKSHEGHIGWKIDQVSGIATTAQTVTVSGQSYAGALRDLPHIVLLFIGTNDEGYASSEAGASDRLGALIDKIVTALPESLLVVSTIYPFPGCKDTGYTATQCAANVATYDAAIPAVIKQRADQGKHVVLVDMSTPPTGALSSDGVHPNDTVGYPWMGNTWYAAIRAYLR